MQNHEQAYHDALLDGAVDDPDIEDLAVELVEIPPAMDDLVRAVLRAASELEGQGAKSDRIATQLITAVATFHRETGT